MLRTSVGLLTAVGLAAAPSSASAIVGGTETPAGKYPAVANVVIANAFGCTGTLIAPDWILTAGHCSSLTGGLGVATPLAYPPSSFSATVGTVNASGAGGERVAVDRVVVPSGYLMTQGFDTSLLHLSKPAATAPTQVAGRGYAGLYAKDVFTDVVGFGVTSEDGDAPAKLQEVGIPIVGDAECGADNSSFEAGTQLCGGYAEGGKDSCQGDSGGPMFSSTRGGLRLVVGAVSYGDGCARANSPGVYARVGADTLREFIRTNAPAGVRDAPAGADVTPARTYDRATKRVVTASASGTSGTPSGGSTTGGERFTASLAVDRRTRRSTFRGKGLRVRFKCSAACSARIVLRVDARTQKLLKRRFSAVGAKTVRRTDAGRTTFTLKLSKALARSLTKRRSAKVSLTATVKERGGKGVSSVRRTVVLTGR